MKNNAGVLLLITGLLVTSLLAGCVLPGSQEQAGSPSFRPTTSQSPGAGPVLVSYPVVDTGQVKCYDTLNEIPCPMQGQAFYGQDAQVSGNQPSYTLSSDGLTIYDRVTGLTWERSPDTNGDVLTKSDKLTFTQAEALPATLKAKNYGGYSDWRLPTIKELYSLMDFRGTDPSPTGTDTSGLTPFLDTRYFTFAYGQTSEGERIIDSQYASSTLYVSGGPGGTGKLFGVNYADGRIKGYDLTRPGGADKTFFVICVRGNPEYGKNSFFDNGDGTVTIGRQGWYGPNPTVDPE